MKGEQEEEKEKEKDEKKEQKNGSEARGGGEEPPLCRVFRTKHNLPAFSLLGAQEATLPC